MQEISVFEINISVFQTEQANIGFERPANSQEIVIGPRLIGANQRLIDCKAKHANNCTAPLLFHLEIFVRAGRIAMF